jgi:hypothetical protein
VLRKEFRKPYNHNSCTSFVIAMQYKLHGIGADAGTPAEQARQFLACISRDEALKRELICLEHRRWVTEKLCAGYRCITDLNECAGGSMKDERRKRHVCIVRSPPDAGLSSPAWTTPEGLPDPVKWDHPSPEALAALDELDRMSVELHLMHRRHADAEKAQQIVQSAIDSGKKFNIIYAENDDMAKGAVAALDKAGITHGIDGEVIIVAFDGNKWALEEVLEGNWNLDVQNSPYQAAYIDDVIKKLENGEKISSKTIIVEDNIFDARTITQSDVDKYGF